MRTLAQLAASLACIAGCADETHYVYVDDDDGTGIGATSSSEAASSGGAGGAGGTGATQSAGTGGAEPILAPLVLDFPARHVIADPARGRFLATVPSTSPLHADSLVALGPDGEVQVAIEVGGDPGVMAMSDDGSTLWVGIDAMHGVRRLDLDVDPPVLGDLHELPRSDSGDDPLVIGSMAVVAGTTAVLAASLHLRDVTPHFDAFVVLDDGEPRGAALGRPDAHMSRVVAGSPGLVYAYDDESTGSELYVVDVDGEAPRVDAFGGFLVDFNVDAQYDEGRIFIGSGEVLDVSSPEAPFRAGLFPHRPFVVTVAGGRVHGLTRRDETSLYLRRFDPATFTQVDALAIAVGAVLDDFEEPETTDIAVLDGPVYAITAFDAARVSRLYIVDESR